MEATGGVAGGEQPGETLDHKPTNYRNDPQLHLGTTAPWSLGLFWATPQGPWHRFATVCVHEDPQATGLRFDPVDRPPPGASTYGWARSLRVPSYRYART